MEVEVEVLEWGFEEGYQTHGPPSCEQQLPLLERSFREVNEVCFGKHPFCIRVMVS